MFILREDARRIVAHLQPGAAYVDRAMRPLRVRGALVAALCA
jgi:hypothetical protein